MEKKSKVVILDNGHGIETPGKRSPDGNFREYKWTREFVKILKIGLEEYGYDVFNIVPEDKDLGLTSRANRANKIIEEYGAGNCIFVSVHNNAAGMGDKWYNATGWSVYTTTGVTKSDKLANLLYEEIEALGINTRKDTTDGDYDYEEDFTVIKKTNCPAVLTENMFMDSKKDVEFLTSEEGFISLIKGHINGIRRYFEDPNGTHDEWIQKVQTRKIHKCIANK